MKYGSKQNSIIAVKFLLFLSIVLSFTIVSVFSACSSTENNSDSQTEINDTENETSDDKDAPSVEIPSDGDKVGENDNQNAENGEADGENPQETPVNDNQGETEQQPEDDSNGQTEDNTYTGPGGIDGGVFGKN